MDDEAKWFFVFMSVFVFSGFAAMSIVAYCNSIESTEAIKAGLVQEVVDGSKVWVKPDGE